MPKNKKTGSRSFGAFSGVFVPTFLSIVGVILFLRLGYIVGGAGIGGAIIIILLGVSVTLSTGLALSSIASNIKIGAGGAYSIISKTLGLEVGGSVGIPLFLAQTFSVALYVFGFTEAWMFLFPGSDFLMVALGIFIVLFFLTFISTRLAVSSQVAVFVLICLVLGLIFLGGNFSGAPKVPMFQPSGEIPFWSLFALFFPAVTGLMAGIGMSGELTDPKKQIPKGILVGLGITTLIYLAVVVLLGYSATAGQLLQNNLIVAEISYFPQVVLLGIIAATFSSALTTLVAAPRVLQALAENSVLPRSGFLSKKTKEGEPRNAIWVTSAIIFFLLLVGSLNSVAQVLTVFFLITYAMINVSVFIEQCLGLTSFRPTFRIPKFVSFYGAASSIVIILLINVFAGLGSIVFVILIYALLMKKPLKPKEGDIRSGLFRSLSEWAAKKTTELPQPSKHTWRPNILIPVLTTRTLFGNFPLIKSIAHPNGTMTVLGFRLRKNIRENPEEKNITKKQIKKELDQLPNLVKKFGKSGIFTSFSIIDAEEYTNALIVAMEAIESQVFSPNILFLPYKPDKLSVPSLKKIIRASEEKEAGVAIFDRDAELGLGSEEDIHLWLSPKVLEKDLYEERHYDLAMLMAYGIHRNWNGKINLWMCVKNKKKKKEAEKYMKKLIYEARFPTSTKINIKTGSFKRNLKKAPEGDIHIIPFEEEDIKKVFKIAKIEGRSFLFVLDSTRESALA